MIVATWNVNSIRARLDRLLAWLQRRRPDVVCLQELKVADEAFPDGPLRALGYHAAVWGQKTYNGVAILSREEPREVRRGLGDGDPQARLIAARVGDIRVVNVYVPNGEAPGSDKYAYKLAWMGRLRDWLARQCSPAEPLAVCGDFNVAPDDRDVARPELWADSVLCRPEVRAALAGILAWGLEDVVRRHHPGGGVYSWWDYRMLAFPRNNGLRLDHVFATRVLAGRCTSAEVDREERGGDRPSDHAPVIATFREDFS